VFSFQQYKDNPKSIFGTPLRYDKSRATDKFTDSLRYDAATAHVRRDRRHPYYLIFAKETSKTRIASRKRSSAPDRTR